MTHQSTCRQIAGIVLLHLDLGFVIREPKNPGVTVFSQIRENVLIFKFFAPILDPSLKIFNFRLQIRNQQLQKPPNTHF